MRCFDAVRHYTRDAEVYDYFAPLSGPDADSARRVQQAVLSRLDARPGMRILDLGSGNGWLSSAPALRDCLIVHLDIGLANLRRIRREGNACVCADAAHLPFRDGAFDRVVASEVLEHCNDPAAVLRSLARSQKRGGMLVASTPYRETIRSYLCIHCNQPTPANAHLHSFDEHVLRPLLSAAGYEWRRHALLQGRVFIASRASYLLRFLPYTLWRLVDACCIFVCGKANTILLTAYYPSHRHCPATPARRAAMNLQHD